MDSSVDTEPVVIYRESKPQQNPFGPTHAYGYQDIIFEVISPLLLLYDYLIRM
ncbi:unnamed protein product [Trichobilharzia regenti]|nr:unnamed protein product [Trichobilharzia regenti]